MPKIARFSSRVLSDFFMQNHGLLLTAAVAQNMMLSLIPLCAVLMVIVSHFFEQKLLLNSLTSEVAFIAPGFATTLNEVMVTFLHSREIVGWVGLLILVFFSSMAFRVIEDAFAIIFRKPLPTLKRKFWISALMPYVFIVIVAGGLIVITTINALLDSQGSRTFDLLGIDLSLHQHLGTFIYLVGLLGLILLFTLFYKIMPVAKISFKRALIGGFTATILWEITRHILVYYYTSVSMVNVIYGSMATLIIVLLTLEAIALILLLGAQVIADLQSNANAGIPWYEEPPALRNTKPNTQLPQ